MPTETELPVIEQKMSFTCKLEVIDGKEAIFPFGEGLITHVCCDCGLTHLVKVIPSKNEGFTLTFFRDNRSTGQRRRHIKRKRIEATRKELREQANRLIAESPNYGRED